MVDTHAHIDTEAFDADRDAVLQRAQAAGIEAIIIPAITIERTDVAEQLVAEYPWIYRAVGIHPHHAASATPTLFEQVERSVTAPKVVAIGEIGLDYYYDYAPPPVQREVFRIQLRIAKHVGLPVIIHNRDADGDVLELLEQEQDGSLRGVLHCFSSPLPVLERALALGFCVSFTGNITFRRWSDVELLRAVPSDRFMLETDSPYMTPEPHRGKRNEPAFVRFIAERLAVVRQTTIEEIVMTTTATAKRLFNLVAIGIFASPDNCCGCTPSYNRTRRQIPQSLSTFIPIRGWLASVASLDRIRLSRPRRSLRSIARNPSLTKVSLHLVDLLYGNSPIG